MTGFGDRTLCNNPKHGFRGKTPAIGAGITAKQRKSEMAVKTSMLDYAFFEGDIVPFADAKISIGTHAIQYGTGAFAGIRGYLDQDGETINIFRLPDHATRLLNSGKLLRAELPYTPESLAETIASLVEKNAPKRDIYIRPFIYKPAVQLTPRLRGLGDELAIYMLAMGDYLDLDRGQKAAVSSWFRVPTTRSRAAASSPAPMSTPRSPRTRPRRRAPTRRSAQHRRQGRRGIGCNLFIVRNGVLITAAAHRRHPRRDHPPHDAPVRARRRDPDRAARDRPDRALPRRRGLLLRHRRPGRLDRVDRRPPGRRRQASARSRRRSATTFFDTVRGKRGEHKDWLYQVKRPVTAAV